MTVLFSVDRLHGERHEYLFVDTDWQGLQDHVVAAQICLPGYAYACTHLASHLPNRPRCLLEGRRESIFKLLTIYSRHEPSLILHVEERSCPLPSTAETLPTRPCTWVMNIKENLITFAVSRIQW